jgi:hypothetical protein
VRPPHGSAPGLCSTFGTRSVTGVENQMIGHKHGMKNECGFCLPQMKHIRGFP